MTRHNGGLLLTGVPGLRSLEGRPMVNVVFLSSETETVVQVTIGLRPV